MCYMTELCSWYKVHALVGFQKVPLRGTRLSTVRQRWTDNYIFMMNINFNSRVIVHCVKVQRKYGLTQEIYNTLDSVCIWKCLPQLLVMLPRKANTASTVCPDIKTWSTVLTDLTLLWKLSYISPWITFVLCSKNTHVLWYAIWELCGL